jgi:hypothetical protein
MRGFFIKTIWITDQSYQKILRVMMFSTREISVIILIRDSDNCSIEFLPYTSATQEKLNSSNTPWYIKISLLHFVFF